MLSQLYLRCCRHHSRTFLCFSPLPLLLNDRTSFPQGTDTLEETAFFLDATLTCDKPVVIVGSMRPSTAISADGPNNLLQAVTTAVHPDSASRGTLVVLNDRICQAYYCAKRESFLQPPLEG